MVASHQGGPNRVERDFDGGSSVLAIATSEDTWRRGKGHRGASGPKTIARLIGPQAVDLEAEHGLGRLAANFVRKAVGIEVVDSHGESRGRR